MACMAPEASCQTVLNDNTAVKSGYVRHPWAGKRVGYIGDSITDPKNNSNDIRQKYWAYLQQWLGITPYVYGISDDVPRQAEKLSKEHGNEVDAVVVFMGTNDFNAGVPVGEWYVETEDTVTAAVHGKKRVYKRKKRTPVMTGDTFKGRINIGISKLKTLPRQADCAADTLAQGLRHIRRHQHTARRELAEHLRRVFRRLC